jgi:hypothetical protein
MGRRKLIESASSPRYAPTGHVVFSRGSALLAVPFDLAKLAVTGSALPIAEDVLVNPTNGTAEYAISAAGSLVYAPMPANAVRSSLVWVDRNGREESIGEMPGLVERPRLSPDGRRVAIESLNDIWLYSFATAGLRRATFRGVNQYAVWSPDGKRLTFSRAPAGKVPTLFSTPVDGDGQSEALAGAGNSVRFPNDWSPDGRVLLFADLASADSAWNVLEWSEGGKTRPVLNGPFKEFEPAISPDGRWLAYVSEQSGRREVYVRPYPGPGGAAQVTFDGGDQPRWGRDGLELFFYHDYEFMRARITVAPELAASKPELLFKAVYGYRRDEPGYPTYDVSLDGRRLLMIKSTNPAAGSASLVVVTNWADGLKRRTDSIRP